MPQTSRLFFGAGGVMKRNRKIRVLIQAMVVALVVGAVVPVLWLAITGYSYSTPTISDAERYEMSPEQHERWIRSEEHEVSRLEHIRGIPRFIADHPRGYTQAAAVIVLVVFALNIAFTLPSKSDA